MVGWNHVVVVGEIVKGRGVVQPPDVLGQAIEAFGGKVLRGLEHHVFEQVGEPGAAAGVVLGSDAVPDLDRHIRRGAVEAPIDLQAVGQRALRVDNRRDRRRRGDANETEIDGKDCEKQARHGSGPIEG